MNFVPNPGSEIWDVVNAGGENIGRIYKAEGVWVMAAGEGGVFNAAELRQVAAFLEQRR